ncbi:right-handed parallel beta-helix repeat-containing protein [Paenibacillus oceani]|uniref:Right-handed parallel beta-helix repeat-containing protein n=1 Tax=Paenibacillus oceani TaxID=2772510 RepID=A0A927GYY2_9BACL|nr:right-handed parallel beta-helix repeat-containing protein [Paenibacillus oceani]MBD2861527.1 right-handed parallel beta-helix repeat-containing protein [Paenibacillus oceani]
MSTKQEPARIHENPKVNRRKMLKYLGAAGTVAVAGTLMSSKIGLSKGQAVDHNSGIIREIAEEVVQDHLVDVWSDIRSRGINVLLPPAPLVGAKGDGIIDDTEAFRQLAALGLPLFVPKPEHFYKITGTIHLKNSMFGVNMPMIKMVDSDGSRDKILLQIANYHGNGLVIEGLHLLSDYDGSSPPQGDAEYAHGVKIMSSKNVFVRNNKIELMFGDGVMIGNSGELPRYSENIHVTRNEIVNPRRGCVVVISGKSIWIENNKIEDNHSYVGSVILETDNDSNEIMEDITIAGNKFSSNGNFIQIHSKNNEYHGIKILNNVGASSYFVRATTRYDDSPRMMRDVEIINNIFYAGKGASRFLHLRWCPGVKVEDNIDYGTGANGWTIANNEGIKIRRNDIMGTRPIAMALTQENMLIEHNYIKDSTVAEPYGAIRLTRFSGSIVRGNTIRTAKCGISCEDENPVKDVLFDGNYIHATNRHINLAGMPANNEIVITSTNVYIGGVADNAVFNGEKLKQWHSPISNKSIIGVKWAEQQPTEGVWVQGDLVYRVHPSSGGYLGWVCVQSGDYAGTPPVFKQFGLIES